MSDQPAPTHRNRFAPLDTPYLKLSSDPQLPPVRSVAPPGRECHSARMKKKRATRKKTASSVVPSAESLQRAILTIRDQQVMLDFDLAELYGVETRVLTQAVKRNIDRFPDDFLFQLSRDELTQWRSQLVTSNPARKMSLRRSPYAFTEEGVAMLSSVLRSDRAVKVNIAIMRAFVRMRQLAQEHVDLAQRLAEVERTLGDHDHDIERVFEVLRELMKPPDPNPRRIGFRVVAGHAPQRKHHFQPPSEAARLRPTSGPAMPLNRRQAITTLASGGALSLLRTDAAESATDQFAISTFSADVTPPVGHPLLAGWRAPAKSIRERLAARGIVLWNPGQPIVLCAVDWCELRNDAYDRWRDAIAQAVGTSRERVLVHCLHQHDAPYADLEAQHLLSKHGLPNAMFDPEFHERVVQGVARAAADSQDRSQPVTHIGTGQSEVKNIACNRRVEIDGKVSFDRGSFTSNLRIRDSATGQIDPMLKTLSFWNGGQALVAVSCYATHPMSYYGRGDVSYDFVGMAREQRQRDDSEVFQIYLSGCAGDVTASKFNSGDEAGRAVLADRLHAGLVAAWETTRKTPLRQMEFRSADLKFSPRDEGGFSQQEAERIIADLTAVRKSRLRAALTLSWRKRVASGQPIDVPVIDFGTAQLVLMPAESFVAYQLAAQQLRPDSFVMTPAYGECAPGYLPTDKAELEGFVKAHGYDWVAPLPEKTIMRAVKAALNPEL